MLNDHTYIAFDFETTGLDVQKDEPIQIGVVRFGADGQIIDTFQSLIRPQKPISELKDIVRFLTGFSLEDLQKAPTMQELLPQLTELFTPGAVVVGHNISFDVAVLQKYIDFTPLLQVDTYPLAKQLMHYIPSYALDVLHKAGVSKGLIEPTSSDGSAHDALHDSLMSYDLFLYLTYRFDQLRRKYLIIDSLIQKSDGLFSQIIKRSQKHFSYDEKKLFLPPLKRNIRTSKKVTLTQPLAFTTSDKSKYTQYNHSGGSLHDLISSIDWSERNWIISATHKSKISRIQSLLDNLFVPRSTLHDQLIFDEERINLFLQKDNFSDAEIGFIAKYFSQFEAEHAQIDANSPMEYRILKTLSSRQPRKTQQVRLCTHQQLRKNNHAISKDDTVLFLDGDWRFQSFAAVQKQSFDPYTLLYTLEDILYSFSLTKSPHSELNQSIIEKYSIFLGVLSAEINQYFTGHAHNTVDVDFMLEDTRAPKTRAMFPSVCEEITAFSDYCTPPQAQSLMDSLQQLTTHLTGLTSIQKRMYQGDKRSYQLNYREKFVEHSEFLESLPEATYFFMHSRPGQGRIPLSLPHTSTSRAITLHTQAKPHLLAKELMKLKAEGNIYIISASKKQSQLLFKELMKQNIQQKVTFVAENITGGVGKNVFHAQHSKKPVIALGGYAFYLELVAKKFAFSDIFCYHIFGSQKEQIIKDMLRYAS